MKSLCSCLNVHCLLWETLDKYKVRDFRTMTVAMIEVRRKFSQSKPNALDRLKWGKYFEKVEKAIQDNDYCYTKAINNL